MDLQQRPPQHPSHGLQENHCRATGHRRHHTRPEIENGRVNSTNAPHYKWGDYPNQQQHRRTHNALRRFGSQNYIFVGSQTGGKSAAIAYTLIETAKLNGIDPQAWLTDILARISDHKINCIDDMLP